jgi:hypothetical protein
MTTVKQQEAFVMAAASVHRLGISARSVMYEMKIFLHSSSDDSTPNPAWRREWQRGPRQRCRLRRCASAFDEIQKERTSGVFGIARK